jgi:hypothetical protein
MDPQKRLSGLPQAKDQNRINGPKFCDYLRSILPGFPGQRDSMRAKMTGKEKMKIHKAANIEEAVELANELKAKGDYNWFRGQVQEWPPISSLFRYLG